VVLFEIDVEGVACLEFESADTAACFAPVRHGRIATKFRGATE
jgi:hypothetical protein